jgi:transcriptional regulator with XRE-family HTH domain
MLLRDYLTSKGLTPAQFGELIGHSAFAVKKWMRGERIPRRDALDRIRAATEGAVTANDFMAAPPLGQGGGRGSASSPDSIAEPTPEAA